MVNDVLSEMWTGPPGVKVSEQPEALRPWLAVYLQSRIRSRAWLMPRKVLTSRPMFETEDSVWFLTRSMIAIMAIIGLVCFSRAHSNHQCIDRYPYHENSSLHMVRPDELRLLSYLHAFVRGTWRLYPHEGFVL